MAIPNMPRLHYYLVLLLYDSYIILTFEHFPLLAQNVSTFFKIKIISLDCLYVYFSKTILSYRP